jgi:hypothetical protein
MTVELWYGSKPHNPAEQKTLVELYQYLLPQDDHFVLLLNFHPGQGNEVDLVVLKENAVFLAELKHAWNRLIGRREGEWKAIKPDGEEVILNPNRPNPFKQTQSNYYSWKKWCEAHCDDISAGVVRTGPADYSHVMTFIVIYPDLPEDSDIDIGEHPVEAVGLPKFMTSLLVRSSNRIGLSRQEMSRVPQLLGLSEWRLTPPVPVDPDQTVRLADWEPEPFAVLVARGHNHSVAVFKLDDLEKEAITVGRDSISDLVISHEAVSRQHAVIEWRDNRYVVRDLGSTSGTYVSYSGDPAREVDVTGRENAVKDHSNLRFAPASYTFLHYQ